MRAFRLFDLRSVACISAAIGASALSGCAETRGGNIPYGTSGFGAPDAPTVAALDSSYKIAPLDTLTRDQVSQN